jgi:hypothetical protein
MPYITGGRLKVRRAGKHLNELERKVRAFLDRHPERFTTQLDPYDFNYVFYDIAPNRAPPGTFGPVFGDVVHNLRSTLDHIAWNLALLNLRDTGREPYHETAFPLIRNFTDRSIDRFWRLTQDVLPDAIHDIIDLQPAHRENPDDHELAILDRLWNADKHRVNIQIPSRQYIPVFTGPGGSVQNLKDGTRRIRVAVWSNPRVNLEPHLRSEVLFEIPLTGERVDLAALRLIYNFINDKVLPRFSRFLSESTGIVEGQYSIRKRTVT